MCPCSLVSFFDAVFAGVRQSSVACVFMAVYSFALYSAFLLRLLFFNSECVSSIVRTMISLCFVSCVVMHAHDERAMFPMISRVYDDQCGPARVGRRNPPMHETARFRALVKVSLSTPPLSYCEFQFHHIIDST